MKIYSIIGKVLRKVLPAVAGIIVSVAYAAPATQSQLSSGRWVKIKVKESGMHQITYDQLRQWGFNNPEKVAVYGFPAVEMSNYRLTADRVDDLPQVPIMTADNKIVFYGSGDVELEAVRGVLPTGYNEGLYASVKRNYYADYGTYFITDSKPAKTPDTVVYTGTKYGEGKTPYGLVSTSKAMSLYEKELQNNARIGARYWDEFIADGEEKQYDLQMPGFNPEGGQVNMLLFVGHCSQQSGTQHVGLASGGTSSALYLTKQNSEEVWLYGQSVMIYDNNSEVNKLTKSANDLYPVRIKKSLSGTLTIDYISALYPTKNELGGRSQAIFTMSDIASSSVLSMNGNDGKDFEVWDVTNSANIRRFETERVGETDTVWISSPGQFSSSSSVGSQYARLIAFEPESELLPVEFAGEVGNQNLHAMDAPEMLIITASAYADEANRLAEIHRAYNGLEVAVVEQEDIYNEFSSGTPMIMGIRSFIRYIYDKAPTKFRSVLLLGAAHWDNRFLIDNEEEGRKHNIPMFLCEKGDAVGSYPVSYISDAIIAMLDYNSSTPDFFNSDMTVSVGRIPAPSQSDVKTYVDKVDNYLNDGPSPEIYNTVLITTDEGDRNGHLLDGDQIGADIRALSPGVTLIKAANALYPHDVSGMSPNVTNKVKDALTRGVSFMSFSGHSLSTFALGSGYVWDVTKVGETSYSVPPLVMFATCEAVEPSQSAKSITETMLSKIDGGAIAVIAAGRKVYMEENQYLAREVAEKLYLAKNGATMGTVMMDAHNGLIDDSPSSSFRNRAMANRLSYNLFGDPEVPVPQVSNQVKITSVNGVSTETQTDVNVDGDTHMKIEGIVTDLTGNADTEFNGNIHITIFDSPLVLSVINATGVYLNQKIEVDEDILVEKTVAVENGRFTADIYVPTPRDATSNRVQFFAESDGKILRDGWSGLSIIPGTEPSESVGDEAGAPVITEMYINSEDFNDGDCISGKGATLFARVEANDYGLLGRSSTPGKTLKVILDDSKTLPYAANSFTIDEAGAGTLQFPIPDMSDGRHTMTLAVSNAIGQTTTSTLTFVVVNNRVNATLSVGEDVARQSATINLEGFDSMAPEGLLVVRDAAGIAVHKVENPTFPYSWNLKGFDSAPVAAGIYTIEAYLRSENVFGAAKPCNVVVHY